MSDYIPDYSDILSAAETIRSEAVRTPLVSNDALDAATGCKVFVKPENLQRTGSFKFRGAYNAISKLSEQERSRGVLASSSGNHAQGIGEAARLYKCAAKIIMPSDAPAMKVERTKATGAEVIFYDRSSEDRDALLGRLKEETGGTVIHPFNHPMVIAGQGTVGLEISEDIKSKGYVPDRVIVCTGGGGLMSGTALAIHEHFPQAKLHCVEPVGFDDYKRSLESGSLQSNAQTSGSICDAIISPRPGAIGFSINQRLLTSGFLVTDDEALSAMRFAYQELKMVVEPGGAVALAAVIRHGHEWAGETVAIVLSGGNVDPDIFIRAIA